MHNFHPQAESPVGPELPVRTPARVLAVAIRTVCTVLAWALFVFWWWLVVQPSWSPGLRVGRALAMLTVAVLVIAAVTALWITLNLNIARGDRRWKVALWAAPSFHSDYLGRAINPPINEELRSAAVVALRIANDRKTYTAVTTARAAKGVAQ